MIPTSGREGGREGGDGGLDACTLPSHQIRNARTAKGLPRGVIVHTPATSTRGDDPYYGVLRDIAFDEVFFGPPFKCTFLIVIAQKKDIKSHRIIHFLVRSIYILILFSTAY